MLMISNLLLIMCVLSFSSLTMINRIIKLVVENCILEELFYKDKYGRIATSQLYSKLNTGRLA